MFKKIIYTTLLVFVFLTSPAFGFTNDPQVPEDKYIVNIEVNIMPRNVAFFYDTNQDGVVDVIFYFPIINDWLAKNVAETKQCNYKRYNEDVFPICGAVVDNGDHWLVYVADISIQPVYMVIKNFTAFEYAVTPSGNIIGVDQSYKDIKEYVPENDPQYKDLMDFSEAQ